MTSQISTKKSGVNYPVPRYIIPFKKVKWKLNNYLPLLNIPKGKEYFEEARQFLLLGLAKKALILNIPPNKKLIFMSLGHCFGCYRDH